MFKRLFPCLGFVIVMVSLTTALAQEEPASRSRNSLAITASASAEGIRFTAPSSVVQIRLEVYNSAGRKLFDNEVRGGNVLDWRLQDGQAVRLEDDTYLCAITVKSASGKLTQRIGSVTVARGVASVQQAGASQMSAQQSQAVGPVEENSSLSVLSDNETETPTVIAHNGEDGLITRGKGALSFRIGDFYTGKDTEQMRLTPEGNLGIGITHPQARLDVDGVIRSSQGIMFPDGSVQYSAASKTLGAKSITGDLASNQILGGKHKFQIEASGIGTQTHLAKWVDSVGGLGDSIITETPGGLLGIGTASPDSLLNIQGAVPSLLGHLTVIRTTGSNSGFGLLMDAIGTGNNNLGFAIGGAPKASMAWDNSRNFLGFANFLYSISDFSLRVNSNGSLTFHDGASSIERFRITAGGNVGIGTSNPLRALQLGSSIDALFTMEPMDGSPNAGYIRFGDNTGWKMHIGRSREGSAGGGAPLNTGTTGALMTIQDNGNVGLGTTTPQARLDVRGDVKMGSTGQLFAAAGDEKLRIIRGTINANGTIAAGSGFTITHINAGVYYVYMNTDFSGIPTCTVTVGFNHLTWVVTEELTTHRIKIVLFNDSSGAGVDEPFSFIAIGAN